jgi:outer membrane translocation and assembly module TamA
MKQYQEAHDQLVKTIGKQQADAYLATMLDTEKKTGEMMAQMSQQGSDTNSTAGQFQAQAAKAVQDLEAQMNSLSAEQREGPAYVYESADGAHAVGAVVPPGTPGGVEVVYPNPDFYDRSLPPWEAQSLCVSVSTGPNSRQDPLYPTIESIWNSLDWNALAVQLK